MRFERRRAADFVPPPLHRTPVSDERLGAALRALPKAVASPSFRSRVMARVRGAEPPRRTWQTASWPWLVAAASAALLAWLGPSAVHRLQQGAPEPAGSSAAVTAVSGTTATAPEAVSPEPPEAVSSEQVRRLLERREELERELLALRHLAELPPVVGVEGPSADYLIDLGDLTSGSTPWPAAEAVPASNRIRP